MEKMDYINFILENLSVFQLKNEPKFEENNLRNILNDLDEESLKITAGFNKEILNYFLSKLARKDSQDMRDDAKKLEKLSQLIGPTGSLSYFTSNQMDYVLNKIDSISLAEITEKNISLIGDEQLQKEFGEVGYSSQDALSNQLNTAEFYLKEMGYSDEEIKQKIEKVKNNNESIDSLFSLVPKEIIHLPPELQEKAENAEDSTQRIPSNKDEAISHHIQSIQQENGEERAEQVEEILVNIKKTVKDSMNENQEKVLRQMHPDRLSKALKMLNDCKRKSKRINLYLEWFTNSFLLSKIELKVEHWQVSSAARQGSTGVYTAGIDFSRYDNIIREFPDSKLQKVVNITNKILVKPTKKTIQKLGQDLIAETGFDEHLYFTD